MWFSHLAPDKIFALRLLAAQKKYLIWVFLLTTLAAVAELLPFILLYQIFDVIVQHEPLTMHYLMQLALLMCVAVLMRYILYGVAYYLSHMAAFSVQTGLRYELMNKLAYAPLPWLQQNSSGALRQAVIQDVEKVETFIAHHTVEGLAALVCPLVSGIYLCFFDWRLGLATLLIAPVAMLASSLAMRNISDRYDDYELKSAQLNGANVEYVRNIAVMKIFNLSVQQFERLRTLLGNYYGLVLAITRKVMGGWSVFTTLLSANVLFILPLGIRLYMQGKVKLATIALALMMGAGILRPLLKISLLRSQLNEILAGLRCLLSILDLPEPASRPSVPLSEPVCLALDGVSFSYGEHEVIHEVSMQLLPTGVTLLLGSSGSGKSTLAQLLAGLLLPDKGRVMLNEADLQSFPDNERAGLIALVTQEPFLFQGTILDNLCLGNATITSAEITTALKVSQAEEFVSSLPDGLETQINEQGLSLSGGERQRLAIARALLMNSSILLLDEATAFADNVTQERFYQTLHVFYPHKCVLVIAHQYYGAQSAAQIVVMEQGQVQAVGTHEELLAECDFYQSMWLRQHSVQDWSIVTDGGATPCRG